MTAWIKMISDEDASPRLKKAFDISRGPAGTVDNVMRVHSLRPHLMEGHMALYLAVLHHDENTLPRWFSETIVAYVAVLNACAYSYANHWANARYLIDDDARADAIEAALQADALERVFSGSELAIMHYVRKLTLHPQDMEEADVIAMRDQGVSDGDILEACEVASSFGYTHRLLNGLGVSLEGDVIGYYSSQQAA